MQTISTATLPPDFSNRPRPFFSGRTPLPPSINEAYQVVNIYDDEGSDGNQLDFYRGRDKKRRVIGKRIGPTPALTQFKQDAPLELSQGFHDWSLINAVRASKRHVPLQVEVRIYFRTMWKSDLDNREKFAIDAAFKRLELNDNTVVDIHLVKEVDPIEPRVEIEIRCVVVR